MYNRYEVGHPDFGLFECYSCKDLAFQAAERHGKGTEVYDRLAHHGAPQLWRVLHPGEEPSLICRRSN